MTEQSGVAIIGLGYVGKAYQKVFPNAVVHDPGLGLNSKDYVNKCRLAIVCVPTPCLPDGSCDTSAVEESIRWIESDLILIKSTIPPGTTRKLKMLYGKRVCHSPEYVGEGGYHISQRYLDPMDVMQHSFMILGGAPKDRADILDFFLPVFGPEKVYYQVDETTSELIKYMENCWIGAKVAFCNEFYEIATRFEVDYNELREGWLLDPRVERSHTAVFRHKRGFNTKCIPKDLIALLSATRAKGYLPKILTQVIFSNKEFRGEADA